MISDSDLRKAARAREKALLAAMPAPEDCPAAFSPGFEHKMKKLIRRVDFPLHWWLARLLPVLALTGAAAAAVLLLGGQADPVPAVTPTPAPPSAAPTQPVQSDPSAKTVVYRPTWLPDGCELDHETLYDGEGMITYRTAEGGQAVFLYAADANPAEGEDLEQGQAVLVNGCPGVLRLGQGKGSLNDLFWTDEDSGASFWLSAPFPEETLLQIAESVEAQEAEQPT